MRRSFISVVTGLLVLLPSIAATATVVTAIDSGFWMSNSGNGNSGSHDSINKTAFTGVGPNEGIVHNVFFVFDLTAVPNTVHEGSLQLLPAAKDEFRSDAAETVTIFDVTTPINLLRADGTNKTAIFDDLQSGAIYGSATLASADVGSIVTMALSPSAIADINASKPGFFALGIHLTVQDPQAWEEWVRFTAVDDVGTYQLNLQVVPEPSTHLLLLAMVIANSCVARRFRKPYAGLG